MGIELVASLVSGVLSLALGRIIPLDLIRSLLARASGKPRTLPTTASYQARMASLVQTLAQSSADVDAVLAEIAQVAKDREQAIARLESELSTLESREQQLQKRIEDLQAVPLPVAEHFAALTSAGDKKSARRDYFLFGSGVIVSTGIAIVLHLLGLA